MRIWLKKKKNITGANPTLIESELARFNFSF